MSADAAVQLIKDHYDLPGPLIGKFYVLGLHDNFLIETKHKKYILRVYRNDWRTPDEIHFELDLLTFLREKQVAVAWPVQTRTDNAGVRIECPEGERVVALFHYADGYAPEENIEPAQCSLLGEAVSEIHNLTQSFASSHKRKILDSDYLVGNSIDAIMPFLDSSSKKYMESLGNRLRRSWPEIPAGEGTFGICIGDVNAKNFHIDDRSKLTLFDFDQCGYGFRAFEIAKFFSSIRSHRLNRALLAAFLVGYERKRRLTPAENAAIPYFTLVAVVWVMAIHAMNANRIGYKYLEKPFWDKKIALLKELDTNKQG